MKLPAAAAGKKVRCKACGGVFRAGAGSATAPARRTRAARPAAKRRRTRPAVGWKLPAIAAAALAGLAVAVWAVGRIGGAGAVGEALQTAGAAAGVAGPSGDRDAADDSDRELREMHAERWTSGEPRSLNWIGSDLSGDPPASDPAAERAAARDRAARFDGPGSSRRTLSVGNPGEGHRMSLAPSTAERDGGLAAWPVVRDLRAPVLAVRVRRAKWGPYAALGDIQVLPDRTAADDTLPGELAAAAPPGLALGGFDAAFGRFVYAVRPLWVRPGETGGAFVEGDWLGEPGSWPTARLVPPDGSPAVGYVLFRDRLVDGLARVQRFLPFPPEEEPEGEEKESPAADADAPPADFSDADWPDP